jgi:hypothetical protein
MTTISTKSNEGGLVVTSNDGMLDSASSVLEVSATNVEYNQPVLHIKQAGKRRGAASIRTDDPNPDIEFVETGLAGSDPGTERFVTQQERGAVVDFSSLADKGESYVYL